MLFARVGPGVGVVEVEEDFHAVVFGLFRHCDGVVAVVGEFSSASPCGRGVHDAQAHPVETVVGEDFHAGFYDAVFLELETLGLGVLHIREVGAKVVVVAHRAARDAGYFLAKGRAYAECEYGGEYGCLYKE